MISEHDGKFKLTKTLQSSALVTMPRRDFPIKYSPMSRVSQNFFYKRTEIIVFVKIVHLMILNFTFVQYKVSSSFFGSLELPLILFLYLFLIFFIGARVSVKFCLVLSLFFISIFQFIRTFRVYDSK